MRRTTATAVPARGTKIGRQVLLGAATALGAAVLIALAGALALLRVAETKNEVIRLDAERRYVAAEMGRFIAQKAAAFTAYVASGQEAQLVARDKADERYRGSMAQFQRLSRTAEAQRLATEIETTERTWGAAQDEVLESLRGKRSAADVAAELAADVIPLREKVFDLTDAVAADQATRIEQQIATSDRTARHTALFLAAAAVVGVGGAFASSVVIGRRLNARLDPLARSLDVAAAELVAGTSQQVAASGQSQAATQETLVTVEELIQTAQDNASRARQVADQANDAAGTAERGRVALAEAAQGMGEVREQVETIAAQIVGLAEQARAISSITVLVDELAEQTHLLALNASIEAARAGEHGRGFAVVAAEVRDLAERAKKANAQIGDRVGQIQDGANIAVVGTEEGIRRTGRGTTSVSAATAEISRLAAAVAETATAAEQIAASSGQQAVATDQIGLAMRNIEDAATQTLAASRQAEATGRQLSEVAGHVRSVMGT